MSSIHEEKEIDKFFDVTGRGFASPFLWSQYKHSNAICLIINKASFERKLNSAARFCIHKPIKYLNYDNWIEIDRQKLDDLYTAITLYEDGKISFLQLIQRCPEYFDYNFFFKNIDWKSENEYRYVAVPNSKDEYVCISGLDDCVIEGIVCSEDIDPANESKLANLINGKYELKKISFRDKFYRLIDK